MVKFLAENDGSATSGQMYDEGEKVCHKNKYLKVAFKVVWLWFALLYVLVLTDSNGRSPRAGCDRPRLLRKARVRHHRCNAESEYHFAESSVYV